MKKKSSIIQSLESMVERLGGLHSFDLENEPFAWAKSDVGAMLLKLVEAEECLRCFDGTLQTIGGQACAVNHKLLTHWLLERACRVGGGQAVSEVENYLGSDTFEAHHVLVLSGLWVNEVYDLGGGVRLLPGNAVPSETLRQSLHRTIWGSFATHMALSVLDIAYQEKRLHIPQKADEQSQQACPLAHDIRQALADAHLCLALMRKGGCGVQAVGSTTIADDNVPILNRGISRSIHPHQSFVMEPQILKDEAEFAKSLLEKMHAADAGLLRQLRIPMRKLNQCAAAGNPVDLLVSLRTMLEALFLTDQESLEFSYRLALRAAIFAGGDVDSRAKVRSDVKAVYALCSAAVHKGILGEKDLKKARVKGVIDHARELARKAMCAMIEKGDQPDWLSSELTGKLHWAKVDAPRAARGSPASAFAVE